MAPPGSPNIVETSSSTSDWQIALAPFKRIKLVPFHRVGFWESKNPASITEARSVHPAVPPCLDAPTQRHRLTLVPDASTLGGISPATPARTTRPALVLGRPFSRAAQRRVRDPICAGLSPIAGSLEQIAS